MRPAIPPTRSAADPTGMLRREQTKASSLFSFIMSYSHTEYVGPSNLPSDLRELNDDFDVVGFSVQSLFEIHRSSSFDGLFGLSDYGA